MRKDIRLFSDIHHHLKKGENNADESRVANINFDDDLPAEGYYSVGIHPWSTTGMDENDLELAMKSVVERAAGHRAVAIGECGVDRLRGADINFQEQVFRKHIELSETLGLPLIIHAVRANDIILRLKKEYSPRQLWIIHGFRGKKEAALQYLDHGIALSLNKKYPLPFTEDIPQGMLFNETDDNI